MLNKYSELMDELINETDPVKIALLTFKVSLIYAVAYAGFKFENQLKGLISERKEIEESITVNVDKTLFEEKKLKKPSSGKE